VDGGVTTINGNYLMKKFIFILFALLIIAIVFVKQKNMTWRQSILKAIYPLIMLKGKIVGNNKAIKLNTETVQPTNSFYNLSAVKNNGDTLYFETLKGKKVLIVNTASDCGYTGQYEQLEQLHKKYGNQLIVLGFPANDFKEQEKKSDTDIAAFCQVNYGITFQLMQKSSVVKSAQQNQVFKWLSDPAENGWSKYQPTWNFSKYIIDEKGVLQGFFTQDVSPLDAAVIKLLGY
jgi:glutathione peroxidase